MKVLIQRVENCTLTIDHKPQIISKIEKGLLVFLGIGKNDTEADALKLAKKVSGLRIFSDENGKMNLSCTQPEIDGKFLVVSQFTLYGDCSHGRRPDMFNAARPETAEPLYEYFKKVLQEECEKISNTNKKFVESGVFGADMQITFTNLGPVTFIIESEDLK